MSEIRLALIGCGFVADFYMQSAASHPEVTIVRAHDINPDHAARFTAHWGVPATADRAAFYDGLEVDAVLNLTNPDSHYDVSRAALKRGHSVYSEKPLAMHYDQIEALRDLAVERGLGLASAPCNHLSEAFDAVRAGLEAGEIGAPLLTYAEMDDGFIARSPYQRWINPSGAPWPYEDEFEVGCTLEHAGYYLTWLIALFGSVTEVHSFASLRYPGKPVPPGAVEAPDFSVACLQFESGMVARLTCGVVAPRDHRFIVFGAEGQLTAEDCWFYNTTVAFRRWIRVRRRFMMTPWSHKVALAKSPVAVDRRSAASMDFVRGALEMVSARREGRTSRVDLDFCIHFNEVSLAIHGSQARDGAYRVRSRADAVRPLVAAPAPPRGGLERRMLRLLERL